MRVNSSSVMASERLNDMPPVLQRRNPTAVDDQRHTRGTREEIKRVQI
jgi:hypothetical protein